MLYKISGCRIESLLYRKYLEGSGIPRYSSINLSYFIYYPYPCLLFLFKYSSLCIASRSVLYLHKQEPRSFLFYTPTPQNSIGTMERIKEEEQFMLLKLDFSLRRFYIAVSLEGFIRILYPRLNNMSNYAYIFGRKKVVSWMNPFLSDSKQNHVEVWKPPYIYILYSVIVNTLLRRRNDKYETKFLLLDRETRIINECLLTF